MLQTHTGQEVRNNSNRRTNGYATGSLESVWNTHHAPGIVLCSIRSNLILKPKRRCSPKIKGLKSRFVNQRDLTPLISL